MNSIQLFNTKPFIDALKAFFQELKVPVDYLADEPASAADILGEKYKTTNEAHQLIDDVYALGIVNDGIFNGQQTNKSLDQLKKEIMPDYDGLLIFGVTLKTPSPLERAGVRITRSQLAEITRAFNRAFPYTPVTIIFKYGNLISFANSERTKYKQEWREGEKVGKVSMLKDIAIEKPHAAHQRILLELKSKNATSFEELYAHWQKVFNTKELNKQFFKKIANWYFLSVAKSRFPFEYLKNDSKNAHKTNDQLQTIANQKASIRFITRMIFVWFLKEKGLISNSLFDKKEVDKILNKDKTNSSYYNAILQNLFFATLNKASEHREFATDNGFHKNKATYDVNSLYRYEKMFVDDSAENIMKLFEKIPFLNGGLFDSLDIKPTKEYPEINQEIIDGFSRNPKWQAKMPDFLFFEEEEIDFDNELRTIYDAKKGHYQVKGLFAIFNEYKFTIEENTPTETDVALDPYLLGEIFENLLAYYNPETGTTARKGSGSFYTPQEIVNYMVDESLNAYLSPLTPKGGMIEKLTNDEKYQFVKKLSDVKILDPACGSGAFPMGVLYKMVDMLKQIDPDNSIWKQIQHDKIIGEAIAKLKKDEKIIEGLNDNQVKEKALKAVAEELQQLEANFDNKYNFDDYTRKLYIIQNCIYGVDIQDVAIQISKLRFFLSLIVDQKNEDIKPLPNLETKFVIANTLIGIDLPKFTVMGEDDHSQDTTKLLKEELKNVREQHFKAVTRKEKQAIKAKDKTIREKIANSLADSMNSYKQEDIDKLNDEIATQKRFLAEAELMPDMVQEIIVRDLFGGESTQKVNYRKERIKESNAQIRLIESKIASLQTNTQAEQIRTQALKIAQWDIYNQNAVADWFDMDWMFGITDGFDVVIGNPPYLEISDPNEKDFFLKNFKDVLSKHYDLYIFFFRKGLSLLNQGGILTYITPHTFLHYTQFSALRKYLFNFKINILSNPIQNVFENAIVDVVISQIQKNEITTSTKFVNIVIKDSETYINEEISKDQLTYNSNTFDLKGIKNLEKLSKFYYKTNEIGQITESSQGITVYAKVQGEKVNYIENKKVNNFYKPVTRGKEFNKYTFDWNGDYIKYGSWLWCKRDDKFFKNRKIFLRQTSDKPIATIVEEEFYAIDSVHSFIVKDNKFALEYLLSIINSKLGSHLYNLIIPESGKIFAQVKLTFFRKLPIKEIPLKSQQPFIKLVDQILDLKKLGKDTSALEHQIDVMVYHLYELSYDEACVIDGELSKEDFERFKINT